MRAEVKIPAATDWKHLHGVDFQDDDLRQDGAR
jgi:hypothetical protein